MRIRLAIYDPNIEFMTRISKIFQQKYADKIELSIFTNEDTLYQNLKEVHTDMVLFDRSVKFRMEMLPEGITAGYLSDIADVEEIEGFPAICKYQKAETIYKMILGLYAENSSDVKLKNNGGDIKIILFTSAQGGSGTSTVAAAYALRRAEEKKKKVFYLNLEKLGDSGLYFGGEGKQSFSDVIFALKSRKGNLLMKMESVTERDPSGVDFFCSCRNAYDMFELTDGEVEALLQGFQQSSGYEELVIDLSGELTDRIVMLMKDYADKIIYVEDADAAGEGKFQRFCEAICVMEQRRRCNILNKIRLLYNRHSANQSIAYKKSAVPVIGGLDWYQGIGGRRLVKEISQIKLLDFI